MLRHRVDRVAIPCAACLPRECLQTIITVENPGLSSTHLSLDFCDIRAWGLVNKWFRKCVYRASVDIMWPLRPLHSSWHLFASFWKINAISLHSDKLPDLATLSNHLTECRISGMADGMLGWTFDCDHKSFSLPIFPRVTQFSLTSMRNEFCLKTIDFTIGLPMIRELTIVGAPCVMFCTIAMCHHLETLVIMGSVLRREHDDAFPRGFCQLKRVNMTSNVCYIFNFFETCFSRATQLQECFVKLLSVIDIDRPLIVDLAHTRLTNFTFEGGICGEIV